MLRSAERYKGPLGRFLNQELKQHQNADKQEIDRLRRQFKDMTAVVWQVFGPDSCRLPKQGSPSSPSPAAGRRASAAAAAAAAAAVAAQPEKLNPALFDATMVAVCRELESNNRRRQELVRAAGAIRAAYVQLCDRPAFKAALDNCSRQKVLDRIRMMREMLQDAAPLVARDQRCGFSDSIKQQLWEAAAAPRLCGICQQVIHTIGDAEVDHVVPHSLGGLASVENAQLAHRFCNRSKGNRTAATLDSASSSMSDDTSSSGNSSGSSSHIS